MSDDELVWVSDEHLGMAHLAFYGRPWMAWCGLTFPAVGSSELAAGKPACTPCREARERAEAPGPRMQALW